MIRYLILLTLLTINLYPQSAEKETLGGTVTFISAQNVYVKFDNTSGIVSGDSLFMQVNNTYKPVMIVKFLSSKSAAGELINGTGLKVDDKLYAFIPKKLEGKPLVKDSIPTTIAKIEDTTPPVQEIRNIRKLEKKTLNGRFSVQSFSSISNINGSRDDQRWRYSFMLNADEISGSSFSVSNYIIFTYRNGEQGSFKTNLPKHLKIYDMAVNYKFDESSSLWFGRHMNRRISNIGSLDGLQFQQDFSSYFAGVVAGSRPDLNNMGFNLKLFEYGGYFGRSDTLSSGIMENTVAVMQQTNNFKTDRRFLYMQHTSNILNNLSLFFSSEIDLFERIKQQDKNTLSLTGLFLSTRFTPIREVSLSLSYDARKDVIYYETFKTFSDSIIERETRQGLRGGLSIRLLNNVFVGLNAGYRFQKSDLKPSRNFNGYVSYSNIPVIDVMPSASITKILSSYIDGTIWGVRLSKSLFNTSELALDYRNSTYKFQFGDLKQNIISVDLSSRILGNFYITASYEGTFEKNQTWGRVLFDLTTRF